MPVIAPNQPPELCASNTRFDVDLWDQKKEEKKPNLDEFRFMTEEDLKQMKQTSETQKIDLDGKYPSFPLASPTSMWGFFFLVLKNTLTAFSRFNGT